MPTITEAVAEKIANAGPMVHERVVTLLAEKEIERRVNLVIQATTELEKLTEQTKKFKPDQRFLNADGQVVQESYSQAKFDERKKHLARVEKLEKALNTALDQNNFKPLEEFFRGGNAAPANDGAQ